MKITILVDDTAGTNMRGEHGLSIFIEHRGKRLLLDTGASDLFAENAAALGIDLTNLDMAVLSHGHYDHSTGTQKLFEINPAVKMAVRKEAFEEHYHLKERQFGYNGVPRNLLTDYADRFIFTNGKMPEEQPVEILPGAWLLPHAADEEHLAAMRKIGSKNGLYVLCKNPMPDGSVVESFLPDDFRHEQTLVLECDPAEDFATTMECDPAEDTETAMESDTSAPMECGSAGELIVISSCSHAGVDVIVREVQKAFPDKKIRAYIGGFHMVNMTVDEAENTARILAELPVGKYYTGHCTGARSFEILQRILGERVEGLF